MEQLEREPNPQPLPEPTGPFDRKTRIKIAAVIGLLVLGIAMTFLFFSSRAPQQSVMGPRQPTKQQQAFALNEEKEKAYDQGKREGLEIRQGVATAGNQAAYQPTVYQPMVQRDAEPAIQKVSFTGNMIEGRNNANSDFNSSRNVGTPGSNSPVNAGTAAQGLAADKPQSTTVAANVLPEGTIIYCALVNQLNGDNTGPVKVQVSNDVPYPGTREVAIPQGSFILGEAQQVSAQFQKRLAVTFHSLQIGQTAGHIRQISLAKMPGLDQQGAAALTDKTDFHYLQIFGASLAVGAIGGLAQIGNGSYGGINGIDASTQIRNGISQSTAQSSAQILNRFLNRLPTVIIRPGTPVVVYLTGNLEIPNESL
jgi:type IV secretory pathway VirB10-like protein